MKFCIVGTGRCGTRLLRSMMNAHPDVFVFNETHWIVNLHEAFGTAETPFEDLLDIMLRTRFVDGARVTEIDVEAFRAAQSGGPASMTPAAFADAVGRYFAAQDGKAYWADKTPDYGYFAATLQLYWPDCKIIHLIRDGANVVRSMIGHPGYKALVALGRQNWCPLSLNFEGIPGGDRPHDPAEYVELWHRRLTRIRNESERLTPGSYLKIRHEDVLSAPAETLAKIAGFTGLRYDSGWEQAATDAITVKRAEKPRAEEMLRHFGPKHRALMRELGYAVQLPEAGRC
ncbi:hypothetical protein A3731_22870 [Roseovarius sp. HI0049]|nr:hypothetical protein A3731_22870 [Roseovarius sp. HI0049]